MGLIKSLICYSCHLKIQASYRIDRDEDGILKYSHLNEKAIIWSSKVWRNIDRENNEVLFDRGSLFKFLIEHLVEGDIHGYDPIDDEFTKKMTKSMFQSDNQKTDSNKINVVQFKLKEMAFFDTDRNVYESRIIGICPVSLIKETGIMKDLCWVYYPELRHLLSKETITDKRFPDKIKTLEDLFFYRDFESSVYKTSKDWDKKEEYRDGLNEPVKNSEQIEMRLIEHEHDIWMGLVNKPIPH